MPPILFIAVCVLAYQILSGGSKNELETLRSDGTGGGGNDGNREPGSGVADNRSGSVNPVPSAVPSNEPATKKE